MISLSSHDSYRRYLPLWVSLLLLTGLHAQTPQTPVASVQTQIAQQLALIHAAEQEHRPAVEQGVLWGNLALEYHTAADFLKAEDAYNRSLHLLKNEPSARAEYSTTLENLASLYLVYGRIDEAEGIKKKALAMRKQLGDPSDIGVTEVRLADIAYVRHQYKKAERLALRGIDDMNSSSTPPRVGMLSGLITVSYSRCLQGHGREGLMSARQTVAFAKAHYAADSAAIGFASVTLGFAEWKNGIVQEGETDMLYGTQILRRTLVPGDPRLAGALLQYGDYLLAANKRVEAQVIHEEVQRMNHEAGVFCAACSVSVYSLSNTLR